MLYLPKQKQLKAFSTIEIILAIALFMVLVLGLSAAMSFGVQQEKVISEDSKATYLLEEGLEAVVNIRDEDFANLTNGTYGLLLNTNGWQLTPGSDVIDGYTRTIDIASPDTTNREITVTISWIRSIGGLQSISATQRLSDIYREIIVDDGSDWSNPIQEYIFDVVGLTNSVTELVVDGTKVFGYQSNSQAFGVDVIDPLNPNQFVSGAFTSALGIATYNDYMYASSGNNTKEFQVIDPDGNRITSSDINLPGNGNGQKMAVVGDYLFYTRLRQNNQAQFYVFSLANPAVPVVVDSINTNTNINFLKIVTAGDYAIVSTNSNSSELVIIDISDPTNAEIVAGLDLPSNGTVKDMVVAGNRLFLSRLNSNDLYEYDITDIMNPVSLSVTDIGARPITMDTNHPNNTFLYLGTNIASGRFRVWDISTYGNPVYANQIAYTWGINDLEYIPEIDRVVAGTANSNQELLIFKPGE